ncbi:angiopoietin-related protein 7-like [Drosophila eugracilis]|uniref:angiopoietin-related protein 7-like n=1 Tax=Drosophila eugracilis TaxID=29029 RepID=UPI0007E6B15D|nr:angiopoietin-related protein 7-like [Drosophila eugracilis]
MKAICLLLSVFSLCLAYLASAEAVENAVPQIFKKYSTSCKELNPKKSGVQKIRIGNDKIDVYCDVTIAGKGWLVIQRRVSVDTNFFRNWTSYEEGFGDLKGNFFIGLRNLNKIASLEPQELYIELEDFSGERRYAHYDLFNVGNVYSNYSLIQLGKYSGNAGDDLRYQLNQSFSTFDRDNDNSTLNCASRYRGAWWYNDCLHSNLNGVYLDGGYSDSELFAAGIIWGAFKGYTYSLKTVNIMVRPK